VKAKLPRSLLLNYSALAVLVLSLVGYPLIAPISILLEVPNRFVSVPFRLIVLSLSIFVIIKRFVLRARFRPVWFWILWWFFWGLYINRIIVDGLWNPEVLRLELLEYLLYAIGISLLPAVAVSVGVDDFVLDRAVFAILVLGGLAAIFNIWVIASEESIVSLLDLTFRRRQTNTLDPISISHLGVTLLILSTWAILRDNSSGLMKRALIIICSLVGALTALLGAARGPLLVLSLTLPLAFYLGKRSFNRRNLFRLFLVITLLFLGFCYLLINHESFSGLRRMGQSVFTDDRRITLYTEGLDLFLEYPLLGAGTEPLGFYPHNVILESFILAGVFSGFPFVSMVFLSMAGALRLLISCPSISWISLLYLQFMISAMFSGALYDNAAMWIFMALVISNLSRLRSQKRKVALIKQQVAGS